MEWRGESRAKAGEVSSLAVFKVRRHCPQVTGPEIKCDNVTESRRGDQAGMNSNKIPWGVWGGDGNSGG